MPLWTRCAHDPVARLHCALRDLVMATWARTLVKLVLALHSSRAVFGFNQTIEMEDFELQWLYILFRSIGTDNI